MTRPFPYAAGQVGWLIHVYGDPKHATVKGTDGESLLVTIAAAGQLKKVPAAHFYFALGNAIRATYLHSLGYLPEQPDERARRKAEFEHLITEDRADSRVDFDCLWAQTPAINAHEVLP